MRTNKQLCWSLNHTTNHNKIHNCHVIEYYLLSEQELIYRSSFLRDSQFVEEETKKWSRKTSWGECLVHCCACCAGRQKRVQPCPAAAQCQLSTSTFSSTVDTVWFRLHDHLHLITSTQWVIRVRVSFLLCFPGDELMMLSMEMSGWVWLD